MNVSIPHINTMKPADWEEWKVDNGFYEYKVSSTCTAHKNLEHREVEALLTRLHLEIECDEKNIIDLMNQIHTLDKKP